MSQLTSFMQTSLDGFFADEHGNLDWAHTHDPEYDAFVADNARGGSALLFGRTTYDMMVSFWPTPMAAKQMPVVAERMNAMPKFVVSRTMKSASWANTQVLRSIEEIAAKKRDAHITVLGSGTIVRQLVEARLLDELQIVVSPLVLGRGLSIFEKPASLRLLGTRSFQNGKVLLRYAPGA